MYAKCVKLKIGSLVDNIAVPYLYLVVYTSGFISFLNFLRTDSHNHKESYVSAQGIEH